MLSMSELLSSMSDPGPVDLDPLAARLVPEGLGVVGMGFSEGYLHVAWHTGAPSPGEIAKVSSLVGMPVKPVVLDAAEFADLQVRANASVLEMTVDAPGILDLALQMGASDVHITAGRPPAFRSGGRLAAVGAVPLSAAEVGDVVTWLVGQGPSEGSFSGDMDCAAEYRGWRLRVNVFRQMGRLAAAVRLIPGQPPKWDSVGLPDVIANFAHLSRGLVLFAGPTGSGKSTSQAALLDIVNNTSERHIVTIEDPIEYVHPQRSCIVHQREVGADTNGFAIALRAALRQDPDVILVGEMRDPETMSTTLTAAETGHLVFATVHAGSTSQAVDRIVDSFPAESKALVRTQLAACLVGIVHQELLPAAGRPGQRQAVAEVLVMHDAARAHVRSGEVYQLRNDFRLEELGSMSFDQALALAVAKGQVERAEAASRVHDLDAFSLFLRSALS